MTEPVMQKPSMSRFAAVATAMAILLGGCAPAVVAPRGTLPPVPAHAGPLEIDVVYPPEDALVAVRDSTFIFGSVGTGEAQLTINGSPVEVAANGAFLAFLPVPADGIYTLEAAAAGQAQSAVRRVQLPAAPAAAAEQAPGVRIVEGSVSPSGVMTGVAGEQVQVRVRGTPGATATLVLPDGRRIPLVEQAAVDRETAFMVDRAVTRPDVAQYVGSFALTTSILGTDTVAPRLVLREGYVEPQRLEALRESPQQAFVELARDGQVARTPLPATIGVLDATATRVGVAATARPDSTVIARKLPGPNNPYQWFFPNGTRFQVDGESGDFYRLRLAPDFHVWVESRDIRLLPAGTPAPRGEVSTINVVPGDEHASVTFSMTERLPYHVEPRTDGVSVTFFGATSRTGFASYGRTHPFIDRVRWQQLDDTRYRVEIDTAEPVWGFLHGWNAAGNLEVRLRRPPLINPAAPFGGLTIAVDAGHPPGGAIGPTRLTEADANLMVTRHLVPMLEQAGARVVDIRPDTSTVPLIQRPIMAMDSDAHLFVSVHFNAFPDGVNPFRNHGSLMLYYWEHSLEFARHLQREVLAELGLPDRGVRFQDLAITRTSWMPAVLTESMYMMFPQQEAALRDPAVQQRIAAAHFRAMESFLRQSAGLRLQTAPR
jgi:N-acetylmuramoyl-L-alanine amidase